MKRLINSKKAIAAKVVYWLFVLLILLPVILFAIMAIINVKSTNITKTTSLENVIIEDRIMNILAFTDPNTGRTYTGIIYLPNYKETFIKNTLNTQRQFGLKLSLQNKPPIYFNKEFYEIAEPLKNTNKFQETKKIKYILLKDVEGKTTNSFMNISIMHYRENE